MRLPGQKNGHLRKKRECGLSGNHRMTRNTIFAESPYEAHQDRRTNENMTTKVHCYQGYAGSWSASSSISLRSRLECWSGSSSFGMQYFFQGVSLRFLLTATRALRICAFSRTAAVRDVRKRSNHSESLPRPAASLRCVHW